MPGSITSSTTASYSVAPRRAQRLLAVGRDVDHEALEAQAAPDRRRHPHVVLDHEHPHATNDEAAAERPLRTRGPYS